MDVGYASARDTVSAARTLTPVGEVTSGRDGTFELKNVAAGYYALDAKPPQGSPLRAGRAWSISFRQDDPSSAIVYLYPGR